MFIALVSAALELIQLMSWQLARLTEQMAKNKAYMDDLTEFVGLSEDDGALKEKERRSGCGGRGGVPGCFFPLSRNRQLHTEAFFPPDRKKEGIMRLLESTALERPRLSSF